MECKHPSLQINERGICCDCGIEVATTGLWCEMCKQITAHAVHPANQCDYCTRCGTFVGGDE